MSATHTLQPSLQPALQTSGKPRRLTALTGSASGSTTAPSTGSRLDTATLSDIVQGLALAEDLWRPHVLHDTEERARVRLLATPAYEVWLLGWTPGQSVGLHDHGGANAAFFVVDGTLTESTTTDRVSRRLLERPVPAGSAGSVEAGHIHDVANRSASLATSIHAYSKPLRSMGFYDLPEPGVHGHRVRTLWVEDETAVLSSSRVDALLEVSREGLQRVSPHDLAGEVVAGGVVVDIRPTEYREHEGELPGAVVIERNVLEWRFDPTSEHRLPFATDDARVILVCNEGYASSLAAAALRRLGIHRATDLEGGFRAWRRLATA